MSFCNLKQFIPKINAFDKLPALPSSQYGNHWSHLSLVYQTIIQVKNKNQLPQTYNQKVNC
jgi:hypothetical protein